MIEPLASNPGLPRAACHNPRRLRKGSWQKRRRLSRFKGKGCMGEWANGQVESKRFRPEIFQLDGNSGTERKGKRKKGNYCKIIFQDVFFSLFFGPAAAASWTRNCTHSICKYGMVDPAAAVYISLVYQFELISTTSLSLARRAHGTRQQPSPREAAAAQNRERQGLPSVTNSSHRVVRHVKARHLCDLCERTIVRCGASVSVVNLW